MLTLVGSVIFMFQFTHPGRGATSTGGTSFGDFLPFQFTHPGRGATGHQSHNEQRSEFQFTHPGRGATVSFVISNCLCLSFNSRTPGGVRLELSIKGIHTDTSFNSRTPGGVRRAGNQIVNAYLQFQFTHPGRGATAKMAITEVTREFQFTHPGRGATQGPPPLAWP